MIYTIGFWWALVYGILAVAGIVGGIIWAGNNLMNRDRVGVPVFVFALGLGFLYLWFFAATHFRVPVNQRALLINTVTQQVIGVRESGVQTRPILGVRIDLWPAYTQYDLLVDMGPGVDSATTKTGTSVFVDTRIFLDLSHMDLAEAFRASNGKWETFYEKNLRPGLMGVTRNVSDDYSTSEHTYKRGEWQVEFEKQTKEYLSDPKKGFGIVILEGRSVMAWDFVSPEDATAYDNANRAAYLVMQRENEKAALLIEKEMAQTRSEMLSLAANGSVTSLQAISSFIQSQPESIRPYLIQYMDTMVDLEYLRLVGEQKPASFLPPGSSTIPTYNFNQSSGVPTSLPPITTPVPNQ